MREIKFRAWDKHNMMMVDLGPLLLDRKSKYNVRGIGLTADGNSSHRFDYEIMQFTGLKDKNGKEIYEEDVVTDEFNGKWLVKWSKKFAAFVAADNKSEPDGSLLLTNLLHETSEVIGNVYENPELIKD